MDESDAQFIEILRHYRLYKLLGVASVDVAQNDNNDDRVELVMERREVDKLSQQGQCTGHSTGVSSQHTAHCHVVYTHTYIHTYIHVQ